MSTRVLVAKYIRDPRRWEPINVGVVVVRDGEAQARFIGEREPGAIDRRRLRYLVGDTEVFSEWVRYWRGALAEGAEGAAQILERTTPNYWVAEQGEVWFDGEDLPIDEVVRRYFGELVLRSEDESDAAAPQLKERVEQVLEHAELFKFSQFERDPIVEAAKLDPPERYKFHYLARNGHVTVGQRVSIDAVHIHDVLWKFSHLGDDYRCVAFVAGEEAPRELAPTLVHLRKSAHVIDAFAQSAVDEVRHVFGAN
jgi:hypothetical protein